MAEDVSVTNDRLIALETLLLIEKEDAFYNQILKDVLDRYSYLEKQERSFIKRLVEGIVERQIELDYIINQYSKTKTTKMKPVIRNILRMGAYQLLYMDSVPDSAACNEAVKLAKKKGFTTLSGFVNGVLRSIAKNRNEIKYPDKVKDTSMYFSVKYSIPLWMVGHFTDNYGIENAEKIFESFLREKNITIRTNLSKIPAEELKKVLISEGMQVETSTYLDYAFILKNVDRLSEYKSFKEGLYQVMDISSMMVCHTANIKEDSIVLDMCAAPGGKTLHAADILRGSGKVIARDISDTKVELIRDNLNRSGFENVTTEVFSALDMDKELLGKADVVLADLPCSGLGIIGRKADIKYRVKEEDFTSLKLLQRDMLKNAAEYLKDGGTLIYSTCTIDRKENEENVDYIINELGLRPVDIREALPETLIKDMEGYQEKIDNYIQILPGICESDGFFVSKFIK